MCCKYYHILFEKLPVLQDIDSLFSYPLIAINNKEIILIRKTKGIYKYDVDKKEYQLFIKYDDKSIAFHTVSYDRQSKIFYVQTLRQLFQIDVTKKEFVSSLDTSNFVGMLAKSVFCNNTFHLIGGMHNPSHLIWNSDQNDYVKIFDFEKDNLWSESSLSHFGLVYIDPNNEYKIPQTMLIFGGFDGKIIRDEIYYFSFDTQEWKLSECKLPAPRQISSCLVTPDQRYVLLLDETTRSQRLDLINFPQIKIETETMMKYEDEWDCTWIPCVLLLKEKRLSIAI